MLIRRNNAAVAMRHQRNLAWAACAN
jgi:hypothetical protein